MSKARRTRRPAAKQKQPQQPAPQKVTAPPEPVEPPEVELVLQTDVNSLDQHVVDERALLQLMEDWRKGRASRSIWQVLGDAYVAVFALLMIAAMLVSSIIRAQGLAADCTSESCTTGRGLLPWAAMFGAFAFTLAVARMFGPVIASAAEGFWLMEAPISRRRLLLRRLVAAIVLAFVAGAALGALVSALTGSPGEAVLAWTLASGLGAAGLTAFSAAEQGVERTWVISIIQTVLGLAAFAALMLVVGTAAGWVQPVLGREATEQLAYIVAGVGLLLIIAGAVIANLRLDRMRRARLVAGGSLISGMQGAAFALDFALMRDILVTREAIRRGHVKPTRGRASGLKALVMRDVQRLFRFPKPLFTLLASAVVPYATQALGMGRLTVPVSALVLVAALIPFFSSLRVLTRSKGLARSMPFTTGELRSAASVVPGALAIVWAILVTPAFIGIADAPMLGGSPTGASMHAMVTAAAGFIGAIRWVGAKPANYQAPMMATEMGAMPPGLLFNLLRGFDMVAIISLPLLLGWSPWISLFLALICFMVLRMGGIDQEELAELQEENKRLMEEAKAQSRGQKPEKIKVSRPRK